MVLPDGVYDVMVIDADAAGGDEAAPTCTLCLAISSGLGRGEVIDIAVEGIDIDPLELLGLPGIVEVTDGEPRFRLA